MAKSEKFRIKEIKLRETSDRIRQNQKKDHEVLKKHLYFGAELLVSIMTIKMMTLFFSARNLKRLIGSTVL